MWGTVGTLLLLFIAYTHARTQGGWKKVADWPNRPRVSPVSSAYYAARLLSAERAREMEQRTTTKATRDAKVRGNAMSEDGRRTDSESASGAMNTLEGNGVMTTDR